MTSTKKKTRKTKAQRPDIQAREASAAIRRLAASLPLETVSADDAKTARAANRIPDSFIDLAAQVLEATPEGFPADFDPSRLRAVLADDVTWGPIVRDLERLAARLARTLQRRRGAAVRESLALYQLLKGYARLGGATPFAARREEMRRLLRTKAKSRATTVTKKELARDKTKLRKLKVAKAKQEKAEKLAAEVDRPRK